VITANTVDDENDGRSWAEWLHSQGRRVILISGGENHPEIPFFPKTASDWSSFNELIKRYEMQEGSHQSAPPSITVPTGSLVCVLAGLIAVGLMFYNAAYPNMSVWLFAIPGITLIIGLVLVWLWSKKF
jgi:hypothetical protein